MNSNPYYQSMGNSPYNQVNGQGQVSPYAPSPWMQTSAPSSMSEMMAHSGQPMAGNDTESQLYPMANPDSVGNYNSTQQPTAYAKGGRVTKRSMPSISEMMQRAESIRKKGQREDTVLAHINPEEAQFLAQNFGADINPHTGLPQFGLFSNPMKWLAGSAGGIGGAIAGNMLLPGLGGVIGGALGNAAGSAVRGRKDYMKAGLRGAGMGALLPSAASLAGSGANMLGMNGMSQALTNYGNSNAILPAVGKLTGSTSGMFAPSGGGGEGLGEGVASGDSDGTPMKKGEKSFMDKLLSEPSNVLALASLAGNYLSREKPKSAAQQGREDKERAMASLLSREEILRKEEHDTELERARRRAKRNSYLPEERLGDLKMVYPHQSPEGRISYHDNPRGEGAPMFFSEGGKVPKKIFYEEIDIRPAEGIGAFLKGSSKGQADDIRTKLKAGQFVVDASTLSDLGDGNSLAGNEEIDAAVSDGEKILNRSEVTALGEGDHARGIHNLETMTKNVRKHKRGGKVKLPPKAKSITEYMR